MSKEELEAGKHHAEDFLKNAFTHDCIASELTSLHTMLLGHLFDLVNKERPGLLKRWSDGFEAINLVEEIITQLARHGRQTQTGM